MDLEKLDSARQSVEEVYTALANTAKEIASKYTTNIDKIKDELKKGISLFSNSELWDIQVRLGIETFELGSICAYSSLKEECAEALHKEGVAKSYITNEGTQEAKKQKSVLDTIDKQAVAILHSGVLDLLKIKLDEGHRLVNILQSIQISRASEAKQSASPRSENDNIDFLPQIDNKGE